MILTYEDKLIILKKELKQAHVDLLEKGQWRVNLDTDDYHGHLAMQFGEEDYLIGTPIGATPEEAVEKLWNLLSDNAPDVFAVRCTYKKIYYQLIDGQLLERKPLSQEIYQVA